MKSSGAWPNVATVHVGYRRFFVLVALCFFAGYICLMHTLLPWLDPAVAPTYLSVALFFFAFFALIGGGAWLSDAIGTLALGLKVEPFFVSVILTLVCGVLPAVVLVGALAAAGQPDMALGVLLGGCLSILLVPLCVAGCTQALSIRERWAGWDLPLLVTYVIVFTLFCADSGLSRAEGLGLVVLSLVFLYFRYSQGKESRYGLGTFGKTISFGVSQVAVFVSFLLGLLAVGCAGLYLGRGCTVLGATYQIPPLALGVILAIPFAWLEVGYALAAVRKGRGELVLGQGLGGATLLLLLGGGVLGLLGGGIDVNLLNFWPLAIIVLLLVLWGFLRYSRRLWPWQAWVLLGLLLFCVIIVWLQGYGYLSWLGVPRHFHI